MSFPLKLLFSSSERGDSRRMEDEANGKKRKEEEEEEDFDYRWSERKI
jgi:hypothetical protein